MYLQSYYFFSTDENTTTSENQKLQAHIKQLEQERIKLQWTQVLADQTNRTYSPVMMTASNAQLGEIRDRYAEEYRRGHNGHDLSDLESEDEDTTSSSLNFASGVSECSFKSSSNASHFV